MRRESTSRSGVVRHENLVPLKLPRALDPADLSLELKGMVDVLTGREEPPVDFGVSTLMEVADAYYARAMEMSIRIKEQERLERVKRGSPLYRFRTGELRDFLELASHAAQLGSRRLTAEQLRRDKARTGRESYR